MKIRKAGFDEQLLRARMEVQEWAIVQLGQELHDHIGQLLSTAKMLLGITEREMTTVPDTFRTATETLGKAIQELRSLSKSLTPEWMDTFDFLANLRTAVDRLNYSGTLKIHDQAVEHLSLDSDEQIILFRVVQEGMVCVQRYAGAGNLHLALDVHAEGLHIEIRDDGIALAQRIAVAAAEIRMMKQRVRILGGQIRWRSVRPGGVAVTIELPLN
jgi:signal transduction histidine kinase